MMSVYFTDNINFVRYIMKISNDTLSVLKNFAAVNTNLLVRQGNTLSTISTGKNIFARATVAETFDREFAIYDLNSLLGLLTLMEDTEVSFGDESITVSKDRSLFEYYYADPEIIVGAPDKQIEVDAVTSEVSTLLGTKVIAEEGSMGAAREARARNTKVSGLKMGRGAFERPDDNGSGAKTDRPLGYDSK